MADMAYRAWRAMSYLSGSYPHTIKDDIVLQSHSHGSFYRFGIEDFDSEDNELERLLG
jgi:hypothetical protein